MKTFHSAASRREFLRRASALGSLGAAAPWALNMAAVASASAQTAGDDYRALVCVFLLGGNDNHNTVVPYDTATYNQYAGIRGDIALARADLAATVLAPANAWTDGRQMALHPQLLPLKTLFDQGRLSVAMNVGPLLGEGLTLARYKSGLGRPPKLFSHNDQQSVWQSSLPEGASSGWGGRMADVMAASNGPGALFTSISASGNAVFMSGKNVVQYQVSGSGAVPMNAVFGSAASTEAVKRALQQSSSHLFEEEHAAIARRSIGNEIKVKAALANVPQPDFSDSGPLATQLKIVARLIAARQSLGVKRQVFFVSLGGFDTHSDQAERQPLLLGAVGSALRDFQAAMAAMGMEDSVTTFTGSDFGRTLANNGEGSDHGWGAHHFVMGGAVKPRSWFGKLPRMSVGESDDNVGGGRLLPAIGVDQYGATLASWMGVPDNQMATVFPNIVNYTTRDLGFMKG
jgi:uncharacterized protein (DUF1501 family)